MFRISIFVVLMMATTVTYADSSKNLRVTASPWSPYVSRNLPDNGLAVSIAMKALQRAGYKPSFSLLAWPQDLEGTQQGSYDVIASIWYTDQRNRDLAFSKPMIENRVKLMVRSDSDIRVSDPAALEGYRVGIVEDYAYKQGAYRDMAVKFIRTDSVEENLQKLLTGEIDIAVADERVALYVLNNKIPGGIKQVRFIATPVSTRGLSIAVSRKRPDAGQIVSRFDAALQTMKDDGTYLDILHRFHVSP